MSLLYYKYFTNRVPDFVLFVSRIPLVIRNSCVSTLSFPSNLRWSTEREGGLSLRGVGKSGIPGFKNRSVR